MVEVEKNIPQKHVGETCKIGQRDECCRYLAAGPKGFVCLKNSELEDTIDMKVANDEMSAKSDNCGGWDATA